MSSDGIACIKRTADGCVKSCEFLNTAYEEQKNELKNAKTSVGSLRKQCEDLEKRATECEALKVKFQNKLYDGSQKHARKFTVYWHRGNRK